MSDPGNETPERPSPDELFAAAARAPEPEPEPHEGEPNAGSASGTGAVDDRITSAESPFPDSDHPITSAESPFPDGDGGLPHRDPDGEGGLPHRDPGSPFPADVGGTSPDSADASHATALSPYRPPPGSYGYAVPRGTPGGPRAGAYPAGPPMPPRQQFGRTAPRHGPRPDADGFYPGDYYLGVDWLRVVVGGLAATVLLIALVAAGIYLFDRFDPRDNDDEAAVVEPTPVPEVDVYACAGDPAPVTTMPPPESFLIQGRDAGSRWLAFRNPQSGRRQLWVRASAVPTFEPTTVGVVSCARTDLEFPTPLSAPAPAPGIAAIPTPTLADGVIATPTPVATPTP